MLLPVEFSRSLRMEMSRVGDAVPIKLHRHRSVLGAIDDGVDHRRSMKGSANCGLHALGRKRINGDGRVTRLDGPGRDKFFIDERRRIAGVYRFAACSCQPRA